MSDERIIEVIAESLFGGPALFHDAIPTVKRRLRMQASGILFRLRAAGFDVYRPDECERIVIGEGIGLEPGPWSMVVDWDVGEAYVETNLPDGTYRLVPVKEGADA